jgi:hypothetical protein
MGLFSDVSSELRRLREDRAALRKFGVTMAAALAAIGAGMRFVGHHPQRALGIWIAAAAFLLAGLAAPRALAGFRRVWMGLAFVLGWFVSRVILGVIFFGVVTPIGVGMRIAGRDPLREKIDRTAPTYWMPRDPGAEDPKRCEKPF